MKRESGCYWVRYEREWMVAEWFTNYELWWVCGNVYSKKDYVFSEINETPITQTGHAQLQQIKDVLTNSSEQPADHLIGAIKQILEI